MSKNFSKNLINFFSGIKNYTTEKILINKIRYGLKNKEFKMHLQFIVDNKTKRIVSGEALSRWETSEGEVIMPGKYIGVMEKSGLIIKFDYYMFEMVCDKLSKWADTDFKELTISCNFTRITISEKDFVTKIKNIAEILNVRYCVGFKNCLIKMNFCHKKLKISLNKKPRYFL